MPNLYNYPENGVPTWSGSLCPKRIPIAPYATWAPELIVHSFATKVIYVAS